MRSVMAQPLARVVRPLEDARVGGGVEVAFGTI